MKGDKHDARHRAEEKGLDYERRLRSAVADVVDEGHVVTEVATNRKVPKHALFAALAAAGWQSRVKNKPSPRRRSFGNGVRHGKQLPQSRSDNQS